MYGKTQEKFAVLSETTAKAIPAHFNSVGFTVGAGRQCAGKRIFRDGHLQAENEAGNPERGIQGNYRPE